MRRILILIAASITVFASGCCEHKCWLNKDNCRPPRTYPPPPGGAPILLPPANVPTAPGGPPPGAFVPSVGPGSNYPPPTINPAPANPSLKPAPEVLFPDPLPVPQVPGGPSSRSSYPNDPGYGMLQSPTKPKAFTAEPPLAPTNLTGLPSFAKVKEGLASGRKPDLDGFASLKQVGFKTVIYLYPAGAEVSAIRDLSGKYGLGFVSIETTPERLGAALEAFNSAVSDKSVRPAYVFDDDGVRTGVMWYLYFRSVESRNDDEARVLAKPLGLTGEGEEGRAFELAIQKYLANR